ncbi:hypothetical protein NDU88_000767 [Pleurodeles waltl]|uniref:Uncharacterized protein n=1 Tax=Pleurodeles waltl TaxID=8319 RepID=A0AAV7THQ8_PLEWA|nr:hypothetical protein NDU88_000767 [Pleurodeles waltl]
MDTPYVRYLRHTGAPALNSPCGSTTLHSGYLEELRGGLQAEEEPATLTELGRNVVLAWTWVSPLGKTA